jgi:hypothetical protein
VGKGKKFSIKTYCPTFVTLLVRFLTVASFAIMFPLEISAFLPKSNVISTVTQLVRFDTETFSFIFNILPESYCGLEYVNYLANCQMPLRVEN